MGKFESQICLFYLGGEFLFKHISTFEELLQCFENLCSQLSLVFAKGLAKGKLGGVVDGS